MTPVVNLIAAGAEKRDAEDIFIRDRNAYLNASEAFSCIRALFYKKHGYNKERAETNGMARRGKIIEADVVASLLAAGAQVEFVGAGTGQTELVDDELRVAGTPDGYITLPDGKWLLEFKSYDPRTKLSNLPRQSHVKQVQINLALHEKLHNERLMGGKLVYVNASDVYDIFEVDISHPEPDLMAQMTIRASQVLDSTSPEPLDREGVREPYSKPCSYCPYQKQCGVSLEESRGKPAVSNMGGELCDMVMNLYDARVANKEAEDGAKQIAKGIQEMLLAQADPTSNEDPYVEFPDKGVFVKLVKVSPKPKLPSRDVLESHFGDMSNLCVEANSYYRVDIKPLSTRSA